MRALAQVLAFAVGALMLAIPAWASDDMLPFDAQEGDATTEAISIPLNKYAIEVEGVTAGPNIYDVAFIVLAVTYKGAGISGLTIGNFTLGTHIVGPGGSTLRINALSDHGDGKYLLDVVPISTGDWRPGKYLLSVKVDLHPTYDASGMTVVTLDVAQ